MAYVNEIDNTISGLPPQGFWLVTCFLVAWAEQNVRPTYS